MLEDMYELKINPNDESFYLSSSTQSMAQFENFSNGVLQDAKRIKSDKSFYHVEDMPGFAKTKVLAEAQRQLDVADYNGYTLEWIVSDQKAVEQLTRLFQSNNLNITVKYLEP